MAFLSNWFVKLTGWLPWLLVSRPRVHFEDRKAQGRQIRGAAIVVCNHTALWDFAALMFLFPLRTLRCVVAELMYEQSTFMRLFLKALGTIRVDRNIPDFAFLDRCAAILRKGGVVEIFPEARLPLPGEKGLLPFKPSAVRMALESGVCIIPVYTDGNYFCAKPNQLVVGKPFDPRQYYDSNRSEKENITAITEILREKIYELSLQLQKEAQ